MLSIKEVDLSSSLRYLLKGVTILLFMISPFVFHLLLSYNNVCIENISPTSICLSSKPNIYSYIQEKYWNVGLFNYITPSNALFIAIGTLAIILSVYGITVCYKSWWNLRVHGLYLSFGILVIMTVCFTNIQSSTRFFSTHPIFYYILATFSQRWRTVRIWIVFYYLSGIFLYTVGFPWT